MDLIGIICEYNPLHLGHQKQLRQIKTEYPDSAIVCMMSGNFVQRGKPAIVSKDLRAQAAVQCGADLVLELPVTASLASAERFASEGVRLLGNFCDKLCFGAETAAAESLTATARALLSEEFKQALREYLDQGLSFPAARQAALEALGMDADLLRRPNDILATEYCKAILSQGLPMQIMPILRQGDYHDMEADRENPSATAVRHLMETDCCWQSYMPTEAAACFGGAPLYALSAGERAILARLRTMTDAEFEALPYGSEGLWRKLMHAARREATLEDILTAVKSKRYTRSRLDRMVMCAFLGLTEEDFSSLAPYARVLALNDKGRQALKLARERGLYPNVGEKLSHPFEVIENRCDRLYGLFCKDAPQAPAPEYRVYYQK